jgi:hypothetical protein
MTVNIPFAFSAEDHFLPEGEYLVLTVTPERSIRIVSIDGKHSTIVNTLPNYASSPSVNSRLAFRRYGNEYFLAQVWTAGENVARNRCPARRQWRLPAAGLLYRRSRSLHTPIAANEFAVTEPSGRVHRRALFFLLQGSALRPQLCMNPTPDTNSTVRGADCSTPAAKMRTGTLWRVLTAISA